MPNGLGSLWIRCPLAATVKSSASGRIKLGCTSTRVTLLNARLVQCFRCWKFGHVSGKCRSRGLGPAFDAARRGMLRTFMLRPFSVLFVVWRAYPITTEWVPVFANPLRWPEIKVWIDRMPIQWLGLGLIGRLSLAVSAADAVAGPPLQCRR